MTFPVSIKSGIAVGITAFLLSVSGFAQQPDKKDEQSRERRDATTITGCLTKGDAAGQYTLADASGQTKKVTASSGVDLDKHAANHTVRLTGKLSDDGQTFMASNVEHVSATCEKKQ